VGCHGASLVTLALIFPGQGSQYVGMARALAESDPVASGVLAEANEILGFDLIGLMANGPEDELVATKNAQPALLAHSVAVLRSVRERLGPVATAAGHSLGEFSAYVAAGTLSFEDALTTVRLRGELMYQAGLARPGTMAAILGLSNEQIEDLCARVDGGICQPANFNSKGQVVISGDLAGVEQGIALATEAGAKRVARLSVSGAFHSELMTPAAEGLSERLATVEFRDPDFPVVSNVTAQPVTKGAEARELLVRQVTAPVRWSASIAAMVDAGIDRFLELGPGKVLCGLNRRNAKGIPCSNLGEPNDFASLENA
jgi:[acyl-carrier-protein] S-malonyltransferase